MNNSTFISIKVQSDFPTFLNASRSAPLRNFLGRVLLFPFFYFSRRQFFSRQSLLTSQYFTVLDVGQVVGSAAKRLGVQYGDGSARWSDWSRWKMGRWKRPSVRLPLLHGERFILYFRLVESHRNSRSKATQ